MSLGAWRQAYPLDERGHTPVRGADGKLIFKAVHVNATNRKRAVGRFRRLHGEATFEILTGDASKGPYVARKLWFSIDPTSRKWRVTRVSHKGPEGHTTYLTWSDMVYDALVDYPKASLDAVINVRDSEIGKPRRGLLG